MALPINVFGLELYKLLFSSFPAAGAFISPLSIYIALVLALNGANPGSDTYQQMWTELAQPPLFATEKVFNRNTSRVMRSLLNQSTNGLNGTELLIANAIFTNRTALEHNYTRLMRRYYKTGVRNATRVAPINRWAKSVTRGVIDKVVPRELKFKMVLANAVYFLGSWSLPFNETHTKNETFKTPAGEVTAMLMSLDLSQVQSTGRQLQQLNEPGVFKAVKLPYRESSMSAIALLPDETKFSLDVDLALKELNLDNVLAWGRWENVNNFFSMKLPRFKVKVEQLSLKMALQAMGITDAFDDQKADFNRLSPEPLFVKDVLHSVVVKVNETGTEAAAVTTVPIGVTAGPSDPLEFTRPFIFIIVDEATSTLLFLGTVKQP